MSATPLSRRHFLALAVAFLPVPAMGAALPGRAETRRIQYEAEVDLLYGAVRYRLAGTIDEQVDRARGWYEVRVQGAGSSLANRAETSGTLRHGRWAPLRSTSWMEIAGRQGQTDIAYEYDRGAARYRSRSETFFRGRVRTVDDTVPLPPDVHVDDLASAILNLGDGQWRPDAGGGLETNMVRRRRDRREGTGETAGEYRAEIAPVALMLGRDQASGERIAVMDLTRLSSWAVPGRPVQIALGGDGRPELVTARLMYGTAFAIRFGPG